MAMYYKWVLHCTALCALHNTCAKVQLHTSQSHLRLLQGSGGQIQAHFKLILVDHVYKHDGAQVCLLQEAGDRGGVPRLLGTRDSGASGLDFTAVLNKGTLMMKAG
jgi:hypothetical protein